MSAELDSWVIEMQFATDVWTDVSNDVLVSDVIRGERGIMDNSPTDRVARTGRLTFSMDNSTANSAGLAGYYSPGHTNCRSGFQTGIPVRIRFTFDGITRTKFYGRIAKDGITPTTGIYGERKTKIEALDWMNQAATHEIFLPEYTTNKRIDEIVPLIVTGMPLSPLSTNYMTGDDTFVSVFDTVREKTSVMSEFQKLALSEYGYIYVKPTNVSDEVLTVENRSARTSIGVDYSVVPTSSDECGFLLMESGDYLLQENGDRIILNVSEEADYFDNTAVSPDVSYGKNLFNYINVTSYPRKFDTSATVLYELNSPISLDAGETRTLVGNFRDPNGGAWRVAGKSMVQPVATTDYWMNTDSSGTVTDLTADLAVTCTYGANAGSYSFTNNGTANGYVWVQARGLGIYLYDPVNYIAEGTASQAAHGLQPLTISMPYQDNPDTAEVVGAFELLNVRDPRLELDQYPFWANRDSNHLMSFIALDVGDRVHFTETQSGFDRDRYIDGIKFEVHPNNVVKCTWLTRYISSLTGWFLGIDGSTELDLTTILG